MASITVKFNHDILDPNLQVDAIVNPVNTVGVMGAGLALQFKRKYPANFLAYQRACASGTLLLGTVHVWQVGHVRPLSQVGPAHLRYVINFPTKAHWRDASRLVDIEAGLVALVMQVRELQLKSVAIPQLGCGLGGLNWSDVRPRIERAFIYLPELALVLFEARAP